MRSLRESIQRLLERLPRRIKHLLCFAVVCVTVLVDFIPACTEVFRGEELSSSGKQIHTKLNCGRGRYTELARGRFYREQKKKDELNASKRYDTLTVGVS